MKVHILEKMIFDRFGLKETDVSVFKDSWSAHDALYEDWILEFDEYKTAPYPEGSEPDEKQLAEYTAQVAPFESDDSASLQFQFDSGRIEWRVKEVEVEERKKCEHHCGTEKSDSGEVVWCSAFDKFKPRQECSEYCHRYWYFGGESDDEGGEEE